MSRKIFLNPIPTSQGCFSQQPYEGRDLFFEVFLVAIWKETHWRIEAPIYEGLKIENVFFTKFLRDHIFIDRTTTAYWMGDSSLYLWKEQEFKIV